MSADGSLSSSMQVLRLLYNLPDTDASALAASAQPLVSTERLPLKRAFGPDRFESLPCRDSSDDEQPGSTSS